MKIGLNNRNEQSLLSSFNIASKFNLLFKKSIEVMLYFMGLLRVSHVQMSYLSTSNSTFEFSVKLRVGRI